MSQSATNTSNDLRPAARPSRVRLWIALAAAAVVFGCGFLGVLPFILALPMIGVVLALGCPPDHVADARPIARRPGNALLGAALVAALAVVAVSQSPPIAACFTSGTAESSACV